MIETLLYGCKVNEPKYMEEILYQCKGYVNKEKLMEKPDFTKTINLK